MKPIEPRRPGVLEMLEALEGVHDLGARFVQRNGDATFHPYSDVLARADAAGASLQEAGLAPGDRVAVVLPTCIGFLDAFLGVQLAGGVPAALYPPVRLGKLDSYFDRTRRMLRRIGARYLITDRRTRTLLGQAIGDVPTLEAILDVDRLVGSGRCRRVAAKPSDIAFLQFSSGTTSDPKAVVVTRENLLYNLAMMDSHLDVFDERDAVAGGVCWLPLYHDMGLVGCLYSGLHRPGNMTFIGPEVFITKPQLWLQTLSRYRAVISPAPDFAYRLCLSKVRDEHLDGVDLSSWRMALNGAEPIHPETIERFSERFAPWGLRRDAMTPVYGLAEAVLAVSFSNPADDARVTRFDRKSLATRGTAVPGEGRAIPSTGKPMPGLSIEIRGDDGRPVANGRVGRILVRGPSVSVGYYDDPDATAEAFRDGWLDTGDLGFIHEGELYVAGRAKDLVIIRGRNYSPQEIEDLVDGTAGVRRGSVVALGAPIDEGKERLVVLAERDLRENRTDDDAVEEIGHRILTGIGLKPHDVRILEPGTLPRTSSGKKQRAEALKLYLDDALEAPRTGKAHLLKQVARSQAARVGFRLSRRRRRSPTA
jgi:acyl-CoA synthetase (AMP-forming)/AMP-acid ligase II